MSQYYKLPAIEHLKIREEILQTENITDKSINKTLE